MFGIFEAIRRRLLLRRPFPPEWRALVAARLPFASAYDDEERRRFEDRLKLFAWRVRFEGVAGVEVSGCTGSNDLPCTATSGLHSMSSKELSRCAMTEGFAQFYSADVWNRHTQEDCTFRYYKWEYDISPLFSPAVQTACAGINPVIDCEGFGADPCHADAFLENKHMYWNCGVPLVGRGSEVDWMRTFWDIHTASHLTSSPPSFNTIANWLRDSTPWSDTNVYQKLDQQANIVGGTLDTQWDYFSSFNRIDY